MIGVFDSGIGGLSVVKQMFRSLPEYEIVYFGDVARTPYGNKSLETVTHYSEQIYDFLKIQGAQAIVIACNTASAAAAETLRSKNDLPVFDVISAGVKGALETTQNKKVALMATVATVKSQQYLTQMKKLDPQVSVYQFPCPSLATLIEDTEVSEEALKSVIASYLKTLKDYDVDTLVLGCTHYPLVSHLIQEVAGEHIKLIDPAVEIVKNLKLTLAENPLFEASLRRGNAHRFYVSDQVETFNVLVYRFLGMNIACDIHQF